MQKLEISYFKPLKPGVGRQSDGFLFAFDAGADFAEHRSGVILYDKDKNEQRFPFDEKGRAGSLFGMLIKGERLDDYTYNFYLDSEIVHDPAGHAFTGFKEFGRAVDPKGIRGVLKKSDFDWEDDINPGIPYEDTILYGLNVRAFTAHKSSRVTHKGTFEGVAEKIPYFNELGITSLVLMPAYEFDECEALRPKKSKTVEDEKNLSLKNNKLNCWGFTQGFYFAPKASYAASDDPESSFKHMVRELHKNGLELLMQFYFTPDTPQILQLEALKYWAHEYHVDGFRINGFNIPYGMIMNEPSLRTTKLWFDYIPYEETEKTNTGSFKNLAANNGNFRNDMRRFLKGDEGLINDFLNYRKSNPEKYAAVNFICDYDGFSLADLYSYERKHNEANGEDNRDGTDINYSWNCGTEGVSRKKTINMLRVKEIKNALTIVLLSAGTPYLYSGDEFMNSRNGNNNAYCQDNETGHIKWKDTALSREVFEFAKALIELRKSNRIFRMKDELKVIDSKGLGFPDLSYHGFEAWRPDLSFISRMVGMFFYGPYSGDKKADSYYIGVNMHWENHRLAVPKLKNGYTYEKLLDTGDGKGLSKDNEIPIGARSIAIYRTVPAKGKR